MRSVETVVLSATPERIYPLITSLDRYPDWMPLVGSATPDPDDPTAWTVELSARVGPLVRSKQIRMVRVETIENRLAVFERHEIDGRDHAQWVLRAELVPQSETDTLLAMEMTYDGSLWSNAVLGKILDAEVQRGRDGLKAALNSN